METGNQINPNYAAAQAQVPQTIPKVAPPPTMAGNVNLGAQAAVGPGSNFAPPPSSLPSLMKLLGYVLRGLPIVLTFLAAVLMGAAKEDYVSVDGIYIRKEVIITYKSLDFSALEYFIVVNALVCVYSIASLAISLAIKKNSLNLELPISGMDTIVLVFLLTCNGAASAVSVILGTENEHLLLSNVCKVLKHLCSLIKAGIVFSMFASFAYLLLVLLTMFRFYKRSS
ncbi:CASP-like protein 1E1 [Typha latifolia]|uniref:CASP-like protein 1E1 n=1 Tax=Typha latifolia TaxID=4733 RepID=UPI003C2B8071